MFGEFSRSDAARLSEALKTTPAVAAEQARIGSLLRRERAAQAGALASILDPKAAERMAARIIDRVRRDEDRRVEVSGRRRFWARFLAISVAAHVVAIGFFSFRHFSGPHADPTTSSDLDGRRVAWAPEASDDSAGMERPFAADPLEGALPGYKLDAEERPPVEFLLEKPLAEAGDSAFIARPLGMARTMWVRTSDSTKRAYESLVGLPGTLDRVKTSLTALARVQAEDGSFVDAQEHASVRATATILLAFLSDGNSSHGGAHRAVVERGVGWLEDRARDAATPAGDRAFALLALSEDVLLSNGELTPAEARFRISRLVPLGTSVQASAAATPRSDASTQARWTGLALTAATRVGAIRGTMVATVAFDPATVRPVDDVRTAMLDGTALLKDRHGTAFKDWNTQTARTLGARLGSDGLVVGSAKPAARAEETALILLALEVAYRTY